jgi:hypothetical protein
MKGYIYIAGRGADPALRDDLNDPLFGPVPTLGSCMPRIRKAVEPGDFIFVVSGKTAGVQQYVVGGIEVSEKISALAAYGRFPQNRIRLDGDGKLRGNIIVNADGSRSSLDEHDPASFERRVRNYIVGGTATALVADDEVERGREQTLDLLARVLDKPRANRVIDIMGRQRRLDEPQVQSIVNWLEEIKAGAD